MNKRKKLSPEEQARRGKIRERLESSGMLYLAMIDTTKKWTGRRQDWSVIYAQMVFFFGDRISE